MPTLLTLAAEYEDMLDAMTDAEGCDDAYLEAVEKAMDEAGDDFDKKADGYAGVIRELQLRANAQKEEAKRLMAKAKTAEANADWMKGVLLRAMNATERIRIESDRFKIRVQKNSVRPLLLHVDPEFLPDKFVRVKRDADKKAITAALEAGESIPFAEFGEPGTHLRIS